MPDLTEGIKIYDVCLINPPPSPWPSDPKFKIEIKKGNRTRTSTERAFRKADNDRVIWDSESFIFTGETPQNMLLTFTVIRIHRFRQNDRIGSCKGQVTKLLEAQGSCKLDADGKCQLTFNIEKLSDVASEAVKQTSAVFGNLPNLKDPVKVANLVTSTAQAYSDNEDTWSSFIDKFQVFVGVIDEISEISPYVKVAWSVLSVIPKTIIAKKNRDDKIKQLCNKLEDVYDYITDAKRLSELAGTQSKTLSAVVQQTIECAYFIRAYCTGDTVKNTLKGITGSADDKIQEFNNNLDRFMENMEKSVNLQTSIVTLRVSEKIIEQSELTLLGEMPYDSGAGYFPNKECLPGTRQKLIEDIFEWANNDSSTQILVLSGQAGIGKSAIAHTIAKMLKEQNRLGSMFCFSQGYADRRNRLFSTISRDLADGDIMWRKELVNVINNNSTVRKKEDVRTQFDELIIKPSQHMATIGPVIVVVDALDESGEREDRREILEILLNEWTKLPKNYRIIITTRPEQDIEDQCQKSDISRGRMDDIDMEETRHDIEAYVSSRLASISSILDKIDEYWCITLAKHAQGLFQWAQTACRLIDTTVTRPQLIRENWETCVSSSSSSLYHLYHQIISNQPESRHPIFKGQFKAVVGAIVTAQEPLSIHALQNIFGDIEDIRSILTPFGSFFSGVHDPSGSTPVRPLHTSLFDFFMTETISEKNQETDKKINEYYVDTSNQSQMTLGCLKAMNRMLRFNICHLETSHLYNWKVPNFYSRVKEAIPLHLSYSCRFWAFHLQSAAHSEELTREIRILMDDNLLYYFEALSLLNMAECGHVTMREIANWCRDADGDLIEDAMDAWEFAYDFEYVMSKSTPHLYLSALPFAPCNSFVSRQYLKRYPGLFTFDAGRPVRSSRKTRLMRRDAFRKDFARYLKAFAFSQKGSYYAAATSSESFVWNYITGEEEVNHTNYTTDVVFSPDGESVYCCCLEGDILIWNMMTRGKVTERYEDIVGDECHYCTISLDGRFIIWCTRKEVLLFDRTSRQIVKRFEKLFDCSSFSPNGEWITLYGGYQNVYIWNTRTQTQHIMPCHFRWDPPLTLTDNHIAFQKDDTTIEIRDLRTNARVIEIQQGRSVTSICLSPDDKYIISTSIGMYSIWSVATGELISRSYEDKLQSCLGFSHDSKLIALATFRDTVHVREWDEFIEPSPLKEIYSVDKAWLRGAYLILQYTSFSRERRLQISDITTTNTIIFETKLEDTGPISVSPDEESVRVAYNNSRGLCLWNDKQGEIVVEGSVHSITASVCLDNYLIFGHEKTIMIWDSCARKLIHDPIDLPCELEALLPVRGSRFAFIYDDKAEVWDCESGSKVGETFTFESRSRYSPTDVSANGKHVICMSDNGVHIFDLTGARVSSIPFSDHPLWQRSLNGKYLIWIDGEGLKLFDVDTETLLTGPSFNQPVHRLWFTNDSKCIITGTRESYDRWNLSCIDIWDIQSKNTIIKTIRCGPQVVEPPIMNKRHLVSIRWGHQCHVWDLDTYETISTLYDVPPPAASNSNIEFSITYNQHDSLETFRTPASNKTETLDYALVAWKKASLSSLTPIRDYDGRCLGSQGELLFWVLPDMQERFWFPCMTHVPDPNMIKLNFTNFVHGMDWTKCKLGTN